MGETDIMHFYCSVALRRWRCGRTAWRRVPFTAHMCRTNLGMGIKQRMLDSRQRCSLTQQCTNSNLICCSVRPCSCSHIFASSDRMRTEGGPRVQTIYITVSVLRCFFLCACARSSAPGENVRDHKEVDFGACVRACVQQRQHQQQHQHHPAYVRFACFLCVGASACLHSDLMGSSLSSRPPRSARPKRLPSIGSRMLCLPAFNGYAQVPRSRSGRRSCPDLLCNVDSTTDNNQKKSYTFYSTLHMDFPHG